ncbi:MAG: NAD(P)-binding domain-containing protein [Actinomycetota bacterium]
MIPNSSTERDDVRRVDVCIVGAGPHGLAMAAHLLAATPSLRDRIAVVDPSGQWMHTWHEQFRRLEIDVLRSPSVHHPGVDPAALARFVDLGHLARSGLPYDPPFTRVFAQYCTGLIELLELGDMVTPASVLQIDAGDVMTVHTTAGSIEARHVVWTANTASRVVPDRCTTVGDPSLCHSGDIDLGRIGSLDGDHVVVVGGGLTAGHLVMGALARGADVTLVTRRPIVERDFDVEPGWLGPRYLDAFERLPTPAQRLQSARAGRGGGSMPEWMCRRIEHEIEAGRVEHVISPISGATFGNAGGEVHVDGREIAAGRCWLATGTRPDVLADPALAAHVDRHIDGVPVVDADLRVGAAPLHVTGRLATIEVGPAAGNLWGARTAARRISRALTGIDLDTDSVVTIDPPRPLTSVGDTRVGGTP